jgi:hypothetical protein
MEKIMKTVGKILLKSYLQVIVHNTKLILFIALFISFFAKSSLFCASPDFSETMKSNLIDFAKSESKDELLDLAATFERIGEAESAEWTPEYYSALANLRIAMIETENKSKDSYLEKALKSQSIADKKSPNNSEIYVLKAFIINMQISVDPMIRGMRLGAQAESVLKKGFELNQNNPRAFLLKAENLYYTPEQFGGSKSKACETLDKAIEKFAAFKKAHDYDPDWGLDEAKKLKSECK